MHRYLKGIGNAIHISSWKFEGLSDASVKPPSIPNNFLNSSLIYIGIKKRVEFHGCYLKQDKITYAHKTIVKIDIVFEINKTFPINSYTTLENGLFGATSLTKHIDIDEYKYSGYGIGFDRKGTFSVSNGFRKNCIGFGADMSSSVHVDDKKKYILILDEGRTQELDGTSLNAEKKSLINFPGSNKKFCLSLHYRSK